MHDDLFAMFHQRLLHQHRPTNRGGLWLAVIASVMASACTDRLTPSDDRWGRGGELIAMSGGEGGARYACVSCHGARGEGNGYDAPRLAGLPAGYLQKQMEDYAAGLRAHEVMRDAARFLDSDERVRVANHYAALPPQAFPFETLPATSEAIAAATPGLFESGCQQCHGVEGVGTVNGPPLNAQPAFYLTQQLQDWQVSKRRNDGNHVMLKVAQKLKPEEVRQLSLYLAQIPLAQTPLAQIQSRPAPAVR
jgi:cytochrome c553